jgi:predicted esterase
MRCDASRSHLAVALSSLLILPMAGCSASSGNDDDATETDAGAETSASSNGEAEAGESGESAEASSTDGTDDSQGTTETGSETGEPPADWPEQLPPVTGTCPSFGPGPVTFAPAGIDAREVTMWISEAAATMDGPLVFYWHGLGSSPNEAVFGLSQGVIDDIVAQGGVVVAPSSSPASGQFPWFLMSGFGSEEDMELADEIVACAIQEAGIDASRIHSTGMSAGGLQTTQFSGYRSNYIASIASYSGGSFTSVTAQDSANKFAAMIVHGGPTDVYGGMTNFMDTSTTWFNQLIGAGHFAFMCDHGGGHTIPSGLGDDIWQFFQDHPYGTDPSPYAGGLPSAMPDYCVLP